MSTLDDQVKDLIKEEVKKMSNTEISNEGKKRTVFAAVNGLRVSNPEINLTDEEVNELIETEVAQYASE